MEEGLTRASTLDQRNKSKRAQSRNSAHRELRHSRVVRSIGVIFTLQVAASAGPVFATDIVTHDLQICVEREAKRIIGKLTHDLLKQFEDEQHIQDSLLKIYDHSIDIENEIISICTPDTNKETTQDTWHTGNPIYLFINAKVEAIRDAIIIQKAKIADKNAHQGEEEAKRKRLEEERRKAEEDAPRLKALQDAARTAGVSYVSCLKDHVRTLALNSNEPAEVIVEASLVSCPAERQAMLMANRQSEPTFDEEAMKAAEDVFRPRLILEVIKDRASAAAPPSALPTPTPAPTKPETPI